MSGAARFPGVEVDLGGRVFVVPALSLGAVEEFEPIIQRFGRMAMLEQLRATIDILLRALRRNYPDLERDELAELVDIRSAARIFDQLMAVSGLAPDDSQGKAPATASDGTGSPSMPTSPPVSAGPSSTAAST